MPSLLSPRELLDQTAHMTLATADGAGRPWVSPVAFVADHDGSLYWMSPHESRHSRNLRERPEVSVVVFTIEPTQAIYIDARAEELDGGPDTEHAIEVRGRKPQPERYVISTLDDVTGNSPWRLYRAVPEEASLRDEVEQDGRSLSIRTPVPLDALRS